VTFGDGQHGLVPPVGRGNIQSTYQAGGGASGNVPAGSITQLRTAIPFVAGVMNHEPAGGGADAEDLELVRERGPRLLRHRDRAVAVDDYADLALQASSEVARALAAPAASPPDAGQVGLIIISGHAAAPDAELLALVRDYVSARMCPTAALWVAGPGWLEVTVTAGLVPLVPEQASDVEGIAQSALTAFLDPLSGGSSGSGWPFGRAPHASDLVALLEAIDGLDHVAWLSVDEQFTEAPPAPGAFLVTGGDHAITMLTSGESA
jgi:predicted phage baseplate assembly protein